MQRESIERIFQALNAASVRYLVAGGLAVIAHGYVRFTADVDLFVDLQDGNVRRAAAGEFRRATCGPILDRPPVPATSSPAEPPQKKRGLRVQPH